MSVEPELGDLYRDISPKLWRALVAATGEPDVASDALGEAFAQLAARGNSIARPERWVWKAAFLIAIGEMKNRRRFSEVPAELSTESDPDAEALIEALTSLAPKQRAALVLHYCGGYRTREIAPMIGCSAATVRVHLSTGRKRLRSLLEEA